MIIIFLKPDAIEVNNAWLHYLMVARAIQNIRILYLVLQFYAQVQ